uniref:DOMON domain-containing protein n=1 Tax=Globodera pallida TaxID=36090 RepID=A0A183CDI7_GLOPA
MMEFEIPKTELSARRTAVVLGFNIAPSARKQFYFQPSSSNFGGSQRPLLDYYELEIECDYQPSWTQYIVFGSGVQINGQNGINIPIYEIEMLALCTRGRIGLAIYNAERERTTNINVTRAFLLQNDAFNINMSNETNNCTIINHSIWCKQFNHRTNRIFYNGHGT